MLYTAWHMVENTDEKPWDGNDVLKPYRPTHTSHPCVKWVAAKKAHYDWLLAHAFYISAEYTRRYGKVHKCHAHLVRFKAFGNFPGVSQYPIKNNSNIRKRKRRSASSTISAKWEHVLYRVLKRAHTIEKLPVGWRWFDVAIANDIFKVCRRLDADGDLDVFATYREYYIYKYKLWKQPGKREMKWT